MLPSIFVFFQSQPRDSSSGFDSPTFPREHTSLSETIFKETSYVCYFPCGCTLLVAIPGRYELNVRIT